MVEEERGEDEGVGGGALWPWVLFVLALLAGIVAFFVHTPR
jgi:hypothetical protein